MRRAIRSFACVVGLLATLCTPAVAAAANGQLAAVADSRLVTLNPDGSGLRTLAVADPDKITELAWSPGGNRLAFVRAGEIALIELSTRTVREPHDGRRRREHRLVVGRLEDRLPARLAG